MHTCLRPGPEPSGALRVAGTPLGPRPLRPGSQARVLSMPGCWLSHCSPQDQQEGYLNLAPGLLFCIILVAPTVPSLPAGSQHDPAATCLLCSVDHGTHLLGGLPSFPLPS